jgi:hypothetical protein
MTIIKVRDYYYNITVSLRVNAIALDPEYCSLSDGNHYAVLTEGQIDKVRRKLPNGPRGLNYTKQDRNGKITEAEVYFDLEVLA